MTFDFFAPYIYPYLLTYLLISDCIHRFCGFFSFILTNRFLFFLFFHFSHLFQYHVCFQPVSVATLRLVSPSEANSRCHTIFSSKKTDDLFLSHRHRVTTTTPTLSARRFSSQFGHKKLNHIRGSPPGWCHPKQTPPAP